MNFNNIPFENIVKFGQNTMLDSDLFSISWILGRFCNYACSYCWPYANSSIQDYHPLDIYYNTIYNIKSQAKINGFNKFHWSFSGGEPTVYKNLLDLIKYLNDGCEYQSIHMTTNISPGIGWWGKWCEATNFFSRRSITASFHAEYANESEFIQKCLFLINNGVYVTINQVMTINNFYELYDRCSRFNNYGINVTLKPQSNASASNIIDGYDSEMIKLMKSGFPQHINGEWLYQISLFDHDNTQYFIDQAERFNAFGFNKFTNWYCNAGFQSIVIRSNEVKRSYSCCDKILGTLSDGFEIFEYPKKCISQSCVSSADSKIPKWK